MKTLDIYQNRLNKLLEKLEDLETWKQKDKMINYVFEQAQWFQKFQLDNQTPDRLLRAGGRLVGCYTSLEAKAGEKEVIYRLAEMTCKEVRDSLMVSFKSDSTTITEARARAQSEVQDAELDVCLKKLEHERYKAATKGAMSMATMVQTALRAKGYQQTSTGLQNQ